MKLSIIIPVYNEEKTIAQIIKKVLKVKLSAEKEIIIVNDGSTDMSASIITQMDLSSTAAVNVIHHKKNQGKGAAVITGMKKASGQYIVIQDADLEYDPVDIVKLLQLLEQNKGHVIYGTRLKRLPNLKRDEKTPLFLMHYLGNKMLSLTTSILYSTWITDMECCYKLFPREALKDMHLQAKGFEFEPEITAKLLKKGYKIKETPISTNPRSYKEGKKLHAIHDGKKALWTLLKYKFMD
jgi:dolichol-phosphate mannosyltransferase